MCESRGWVVFVGCLLAILVGCGSPPPPPSAATDMEDARRALDSARTKEKQGEIELALADYRRAKESTARAKPNADNNELTEIRDMDEESRKRISALEIKKVTLAAEAPKTAPVVKAEDPEEKKQRELAAAANQRQIESKKAAEALDKSFKTQEVALRKAKEEKTDDVDAVAEKKARDAAKPADAEKKAIDEKKDDGKPAEAAETGADKPKKVAFFPEITDKSPEVDVVKLTLKSTYAYGYFQVYNKSENGKRIMSVVVFFKNANGQEIVTPQSVAVFAFSGFSPDRTNPMEQNTEALTAGSHQITGLEAIQLVAVGEHPKPSEIKSMGVIVVFDDGEKVSASGPPQGPDAALIKSLK